MATFKELKSQLDALTEQAEAARQAEFRSVVEEIQAKVREYGITEKDIFGSKRGRPVKSRTTTTEVKYKDPKAGATWSGRGRAPLWIKDAKNRERFRVAAE